VDSWSYNILKKRVKMEDKIGKVFSYRGEFAKVITKIYSGYDGRNTEKRLLKEDI
jgi:hypothetical protein